MWSDRSLNRKNSDYGALPSPQADGRRPFDGLWSPCPPRRGARVASIRWALAVSTTRHASDRDVWEGEVTPGITRSTATASTAECRRQGAPYTKSCGRCRSRSPSNIQASDTRARDTLTVAGDLA